jgi:RNA polymerase sigma-70 factor (ECF subfamily)
MSVFRSACSWRAAYPGVRIVAPTTSLVREEASTDDDRCARFERLYAELSPRVLGYALRRADAEEARDVVAETFTIAWRRLERVPDGDGSLPWLLVTARRVLANRRRAAGSRDTPVEAGPRAVIPDHAEGVAGIGAIVAAFDRLSPGDREILALVAWDGLTPREAAPVLGVSAATFAVRLHRARRRLSALLDETESPAIVREEPA